MQIPKEMLEYMYKQTLRSLTIMDERGRSNEGDNSTMLWHSEWKELRLNIFWLHERLFEYSQE